MTNHETTEIRFQNLFDALTDAILIDQTDLDDLIADFDLPRAKVEGFITLIHSLKKAFITHQPSDAYVKSLKAELLGKQMGMINRVRYMPARVQIAAGLALSAGFLLILRRRIVGDDDQDAIELPVLQQ